MNFPLLEKEKIINDPIHGRIHIRHKVIADLLTTREVARLRQIKQLAGAFFLYPGVEHSRFSHSLGTYFVASKILEQPPVNKIINEQEQVLVLIAALLHDIGHGMLSHAFELFHPVDHEEYTIQIISKASEVNTVLKAIDASLPNLIVQIINHTYPKAALHQIISSQLDADRMDYLLRDAYFAGLNYGIYDLKRMISMIDVVDDQIVFRQGAISVIENFFTGRYHMYQQLYFHPQSVSFEVMIEKWFSQLKNVQNLKLDYSYLKPIMEHRRLSNDEHFQFVDDKLYELITRSADEDDYILSTLAKAFVSKNFFQTQTVSADFAYDKSDFLKTVVEIKAVLYKRKVSRSDLVNILTHDKKIVELSSISPIVKSIMNIDNSYLYFYL